MWRKILGVFLLLVGFIALVTPLTPGSWLIFVGAEILGIEFLTAEKMKGHWTRLKERVRTIRK